MNAISVTQIESWNNTSHRLKAHLDALFPLERSEGAFFCVRVKPAEEEGM